MTDLVVALAYVHWVAILTLVLLSVVEPNTAYIYCEPLVNASFAPQPWTTWSNLFFFITSACIAAADNANATQWHVVISSALIVHLAVASFTYHRVASPWSAQWDSLSILMLLAFEVAISIYRYDSTNVAIVGVSLFVVGIPFAFINSGAWFFLLGAAYTSCIVLVELYRNTVNKSVYVWEGLALLFAIPALVLYTLGGVDSPGCANAELLGHGLWHTFVAACIFCLFMIQTADPSREPKYEAVLQKRPEVTINLTKVPVASLNIY